MRSAVITFFLSACMLAVICSAAEPPKPGLTYLYTVNITGSTPVFLGPGPFGTRFVVTILGGSFSGPRLNGTVIPAGGDWNIQDSRGDFHPDVRQTFQTDDGAYIQVFETGSGPQPAGDAHVRLSFETGSEDYYWLNKVVAVGILRRISQSDISIDAWQLDSPS